MNTTINATEVSFYNKENKLYFDFAAMVYLIGLLLIDFLPNFGALHIYVVQYLYLSFLAFFGCVFIYKNPVLLNNIWFFNLKKTLFAKLYLVFLSLCIVSIIASNNLSLSLISFSKLGIMLLTIINLSIFFTNRLYLLYTIILCVAISTLLQTVMALYDFFMLYKIGDISTFGKLRGNTGNINIFAASLNLKIPFLLLGVYYFSNLKKWICFISFSLACLIIFLNDNKAAFISLTIIIIGVIIYHLKQNKSKSIATYFFLIPVLITFLLSNFIIKSFNNNASNNQKFITESFNSTNAIATNSSVAARLKFWKNALALSQKKPVFGVGLGNYRVEITPYDHQILDDGFLSINPHNDFLEVVTETGFLNGFVYLSLFIILLLYNIKKLKTANDDRKKIAFLSLLLLFVYGVDAVLNFPMHIPAVQIYFCILVIFTLLNSNYTNPKIAKLYSNKWLLALFVLCFFTTYGSYTALKASQLDREIRDDSLLEKQVLTASYILQNLPKYPNINVETFPFYQKLGVYYYKEKQYDKSKKAFFKSKQINPYSGADEWYLHQIYKQTHKIDSAYYYAKKAYFLRPRDNSSFIELINTAAFLKDSLQILNYHKKYNSYRKEPLSYIQTSNALYVSKYNTKKIIAFLNNGIASFPTDTTLIKQKIFFEGNANTIQKTSEVATTTVQPKTIIAKKTPTQNLNATTANNYLQDAANDVARGNYDLAINKYLVVLKKYSTNLGIYQNIGICKFKQNKFAEAIPYLEKALNASELNDGKTEYLLGISYLNTKNKDNGCYYLNISKSKKYTDATAIVTKYCN